MQQVYPQQEIFRRRLPVVIVGLIFVSLILLLRLLSFQFPLDPHVILPDQSARQRLYADAQPRRRARQHL